MKSALILLASAAMLATTSAQMPLFGSIPTLIDPTKFLSSLTDLPLIGPLFKQLKNPTNAIDMAEKACEMTIGKVAQGVCDFSVLDDLLSGKYNGGCNPMPLIGGNLTIKVDLAVNDTCPTEIMVCVNSKSILDQLLTFLTCALPQLPDILSKVGTILDAVAAALEKGGSRSLLVNAVLFLVYVVLKKVIEILCLQLPILVSVLITLGPILMLVLLALGLGLSMSALPLLQVLSPVIMILGVVVGGLVSGLSLVLLALVLVLEVLLLPLSALLVALLSVLIGIKSPCADSACASGSTDPLAKIPFGDTLNKLRCTVSGFITKLMAPLEKNKGALDPLLGILLPLVGTILAPLSSILSPILKALAQVLIGLSAGAIGQ